MKMKLSRTPTNSNMESPSAFTGARKMAAQRNSSAGSSRRNIFSIPILAARWSSGQRNVFQTTDALTPFAFASEPYHFSPIVSDLRIEPGKHFDTQLIVNFDPRHGQLTAIGTLLKLKPYKESFVTLAHFSVVNLPTPPQINPPDFVFEPRSNQIRALIGYGDLTRRGFNATFGASYDITQAQFQNQIAEVSYNGSCCGIRLRIPQIFVRHHPQ